MANHVALLNWCIAFFNLWQLQLVQSSFNLEASKTLVYAAMIC